VDHGQLGPRGGQFEDAGHEVDLAGAEEPGRADDEQARQAKRQQLAFALQLVLP
jgi:hypothetical protein